MRFHLKTEDDIIAWARTLDASLWRRITTLAAHGSELPPELHTLEKFLSDKVLWGRLRAEITRLRGADRAARRYAAKKIK